MSVQGVMNTRLQEHVGLWEAMHTYRARPLHFRWS